MDFSTLPRYEGISDYEQIPRIRRTIALAILVIISPVLALLILLTKLWLSFVALWYWYFIFWLASHPSWTMLGPFAFSWRVLSPCSCFS
jgi:hypothetical protein